MTFLAPAQERDQKINGIRKWEQAFRVYAVVYCATNPGRSGEIWQYIYTINSAASSYQWDNVAFYDHTFRQMMSERPHRNWAKNYAQLWQLALKDPINRNPNQPSTSGQPNQSTPGTKQKSWHDRCCWDFNRKGSCSQTNYPYDNRCKICGAWSHGSNTCRKKNSSDKGSGGTNNGGSRK